MGDTVNTFFNINISFISNNSHCIIFSLRENCHEYLNEIDPLELYQYWQQWCHDDYQNPNLITILCRFL